MTALVAAIVIICFGIVLYGTHNAMKAMIQEVTEVETLSDTETCAESADEEEWEAERAEQFREDE